MIQPPKAGSDMLPLDITNPEHQGLKRLLLARHDLNESLSVLSYIEENIKSQDDFLYVPLVTAAVIGYSRPFQPSRHYKGLPKYQDIKKPNLKASHKSILEYRNTFIAHRDQELNEVKIVPSGTTATYGPNNENSARVLHGECVEDSVLNLKGIRPFIELVTYQLEQLETGIDNARARLFPSCEETAT